MIFFSKYNQFDLIKWTVSIPIFNISIKLYDPLNILCWLGQEKSKKKSAAYVAERPLFLDSFLKSNQFDLFTWTVSIPIFNISIQLYELLNMST